MQVDFFIDNNEIEEGIGKLLNAILIENIKIEELRGGTSNRLYKVEGIKNDSNIKLLVRIFGNNNGLIDRKEEIYYMSEIYNKFDNIVPKIYLKFNNGLVYEYLEGKCLTYNELSFFNNNIAKKLSEWHKIDIDSYGKKSIFFDKIYDWFDQSKDFYDNTLPITYIQMKNEINIIKYIINKNKFPICFCHNDLQSLNIIQHNNDIRFIDFEYSSYNYRGFDIGNYFNEWAGLNIDQTRYPSYLQQLSFINSYINNLENQHIQSSSLLVEVSFFSLCSHLFWALWALIQDKDSSIDFNYKEYAIKRMSWYLTIRDNIISTLY